MLRGPKIYYYTGDYNIILLMNIKSKNMQPNLQFEETIIKTVLNLVNFFYVFVCFGLLHVLGMCGHYFPLRVCE